MFEEKISIIVPIYNAEKYLTKCIESVLAQTYKNIELILVDDGSNDLSSEIIEEYAIKDKRIKTIHIDNSGVSVARNVGIKLATGKYIGFIDADDYIDKKMYESLYRNLMNSKTDISICNLFLEDEKCNQKFNFQYTSKIFSREEFAKSMFYVRSIQGYTCNKLYKTTCIKKYNIEFDNRAVVLEDDLFNVEIIEKNKNLSVSYTNDKYYHYVSHNDSVSNVQFNRKKLTYFYVRINEIEKLEKCGFDVNYLKVEYCAIFIRMNKLMKIYNINKTLDFKCFNNKFIEYKKKINTNNLTTKMKLKYIIVKYCPFIYDIKIYIEKMKVKKNGK